MCAVNRANAVSTEASTMTSRFTGVFREDAAEREKFLNLVRPTYK